MPAKVDFQMAKSEFIASIAVDIVIREDMAQKPADAGQDIAEYMAINCLEGTGNGPVIWQVSDTNRLS